MSQEILIRGYIKQKDTVRKGYIIADLRSGMITDVVFGELNPLNFEGQIVEYGSEYIIESGDFNAHAHPEQSIYTDIVEKQWNLAAWCRNTIYKYSTTLTPELVYLGCCRAFSRMLSFGVTSVMASFYCHNNKGNIYDKEVVRAALDTGIRLYYGRMNYDMIALGAYEEKKASQKSYYETVQEAEDNFIELLNSINSPRIVIAPSVHSIHASTKSAIVNAVNLGHQYNRYVQFHLSEDEGDVSMSLKLYGLRPVEFLVRLYESGEISSLENLILSDCIHIDERERSLIKHYGMKVVLNPRMNERIKAGESDLIAFLNSGIALYLGTDGEASNDDLSITGEKSFLKNRYKNIDGQTIEALGTEPIAFNEGVIGGITKGSFCDLKITKDSMPSDVFVGGKMVIEKGRLVTMEIEKQIEVPLITALKNMTDVQ